MCKVNPRREVPVGFGVWYYSLEVDDEGFTCGDVGGNPCIFFRGNRR